jgi:UDP-2-acetamido-3-amino-2,3-dideoxy-glucuronate N-acetyltransferase
VSEAPFAHPTAIVEPGANVGDGTRIWHHAHVRNGASIGVECVVGKNVFIDAGAVVGDRVKLQNDVNVYAGVTIGDDVFVGPSATFTNDRVPRAFNSDWTITPTEVGGGASIGANATIVCGSHIGAYSMVAAGATVIRAVDDHELVGGIPARHLGWVCRCGQVVSRDTDRPAHMHCSSCREHA